MLPVVVALAVLAGCSPAHPLTDQEVALYESTGTALEAAGGGTVVRDDGCLYFEGGGCRTLPIFPRGAVSWDGTVLEFDGEEYREGDTITVGGGETAPPRRHTIPRACDPEVPTWLVAPPH